MHIIGGASMVCLGEEGEEAGGCFWWEGEAYFTLYCYVYYNKNTIVSKYYKSIKYC